MVFDCRHTNTPKAIFDARPTPVVAIGPNMLYTVLLLPL